jgi:GTP cyclohydrolase II
MTYGLSKSDVESLLLESAKHSCKKSDAPCVKIAAIAKLPTRFGKFQVLAFDNNIDSKEHIALVHGKVLGKSNVLVRIHSECLTGDALGSMRCDCRDQLEAALKRISKAKAGVLLYLRQEGRGVGLENKIRAYQLQDKGYDTFEANEALGFKYDERDYAIAAHILNSLHIKSINLMTNNPNKISDLKHHGVKITGRIPIVTKPNKYNMFYLKTKMVKGGQMLDIHQAEARGR